MHLVIRITVSAEGGYPGNLRPSFQLDEVINPPRFIVLARGRRQGTAAWRKKMHTIRSHLLTLGRWVAADQYGRLRRSSRKSRAEQMLVLPRNLMRSALPLQRAGAILG